MEANELQITELHIDFDRGIVVVSWRDVDEVLIEKFSVSEESVIPMVNRVLAMLQGHVLVGRDSPVFDDDFPTRTQP